MNIERRLLRRTHLDLRGIQHHHLLPEVRRILADEARSESMLRSVLLAVLERLEQTAEDARQPMARSVKPRAGA